MIPSVAGRGYSVKGLTAYLIHDKDAETTERVGFTETFNVPTSDVEKASRWMAYVDKNREKLKQQAGIATTGRKQTKGTVFHYSLNWHPEQKPTEEEMKAAAYETLEKLGILNHAGFLCEHTDEQYKHLHCVVSLVCPDTGRIREPSFSHLKLSDWAQEFEEAGGKVYCKEREENAKRRKQGEYTRHQEKRPDYAHLVEEAWKQSDNGASFKAAIEEKGLVLAAGNRRDYVAVAENGKVISIARQIKDMDVNAKVVRDRLSDLDRDSLPDAKMLAAERIQAQEQARANEGDELKLKEQQSVLEKEKAEKKEKEQSRSKEQEFTDDQQHFDRDQYNIDQEQAIIDAAIETEINREHDEGEQEGEGDIRTLTPRTEPVNARQDFMDAGHEYFGAIDEYEAREEAKKEAKGKDVKRDFKKNTTKTEPEGYTSTAEQWDKQQAISAGPDRRKSRREDEAKEYYQIDAQEEALAEEQALLDSMGVFGKLSGKRKKQEEKIEALRKSLENARRRQAESMEKIQSDHAEELSSAKSKEDSAPSNEHDREARREAFMKQRGPDKKQGPSQDLSPG